MNRKNRRYERAFPNAPGHFPQHNEKQHRRDHVEGDVHKMERPRIKTEELKLEHVRNVFEREPIRRRPVRECPRDIVQRQAAIELGDFVDVFRIVEIDERELGGLTEHEPNQRD